MLYIKKQQEISTDKQIVSSITAIEIGGTEGGDKLDSLWTKGMTFSSEYDPSFCTSLDELNLSEEEKRQLWLKVKYYLEYGSLNTGKVIIQFVDITLENAPEGQVFSKISMILDFKDNEGHYYEDLYFTIKPENTTFDANFASTSRKYILEVKPGYLYIEYRNDLYETPIKSLEIWNTDGTIKVLENSAYY